MPNQQMITLTILSENTVRGAGLLGEHGLAYWIDTGTHRVLFDTGQGMALPGNAAKLGIDLAQADAIILSHGHYDHVSGLPDALRAAPQAPLWFHPAATEPKFICSTDGRARRISTDFMEQAETPAIDTLVGGLHLLAASAERMDRTVAALRQLAPRRMALGHCTGAAAVHRLWNEFPGACFELHAGRRFQIGG